jgi:hypothetical protein
LVLFSTYSDLLFPAWSLAGGGEAFAERIADPSARARLAAEMMEIYGQQTGPGVQLQGRFIGIFHGMDEADRKVHSIDGRQPLLLMARAFRLASQLQRE